MQNRLPDDDHSYCPFHYVDQESVNGIKAGQWKNDTSPNNTSLYPIARVGSNNYSKMQKQLVRTSRNGTWYGGLQSPLMNEHLTLIDYTQGKQYVLWTRMHVLWTRD